ncbi:hypothetical protein [Chryseobacterium sp. A301]
MDHKAIKENILSYSKEQKVKEAVEYLVETYGLSHSNIHGFELRSEISPNSLLLTAEGPIGGKQTVYLPQNILHFDLSLILNMIAHEMLHVRQKDRENPVEDKNEREWQAYYEMLFHPHFPLIPDAPDFNRIQFAEKALIYYNRMGEGSALQIRYEKQKRQVQALLESLKLPS